MDNRMPPPIPQPAEAAPLAQILITLNSKGEVSVNGPLANTMLMYGMLELAKDVARAEAAKQQSRIVAATPDQVALIKQ